MATHSSIFTWKIPQTEEAGGLQCMRLKLSQLHITHSWTSMGVQWLKRHTPNAGGMGSTPGSGTKILHAATKTWYTKKKKSLNRSVDHLNKLITMI